MNITITADANGNPTISPITNAIQPNDTIYASNQTQQTLYAMLNTFPALATAPAGQPSAAAVSNGQVGPGGQMNIPFGQMKAYLGFCTDGNQSSIFNNTPTDDSWFSAPPLSGPIVPLHTQGAMDVILTPQHDPNPPHSLHPVVTSNLNVTTWDASNPGVVWILNSSGKAVTFYVKVFFVDTTPSGYSTIPLPSNFCYYTFPAITGNISKIWYGFAFPGEYNGAEAYFAAHPAGSGHHTGELPPAEDDSGPSGNSN